MSADDANVCPWRAERGRGNQASVVPKGDGAEINASGSVPVLFVGGDVRRSVRRATEMGRGSEVEGDADPDPVDPAGCPTSAPIITPPKSGCRENAARQALVADAAGKDASPSGAVCHTEGPIQAVSTESNSDLLLASSAEQDQRRLRMTWESPIHVACLFSYFTNSSHSSGRSLPVILWKIASSYLPLRSAASTRRTVRRSYFHTIHARNDADVAYPSR